MTDALKKNPAAAASRKELREQISTLEKSLAKAEVDTAAAQKERDQLNQKVTDAEGQTAKVTEERDKALAVNESNKDSIEKIQSLQTENEALNKKLADAESSITRLTAEAVQKKEGIGMGCKRS